MFGSVVLDVTIGLVFIFLLYSLLATIINEIVATGIGMRARFLRKGIERMLNDEYIEKFGEARSVWEKIVVMFKKMWLRMSGFFLMENYKYKRSLANGFYCHPTIYYLGESSYHSKPSYLDSSNFSGVMVSMLKGAEPSQEAIETKAMEIIAMRNKGTGDEGKAPTVIEKTAAIKLAKMGLQLNSMIATLETRQIKLSETSVFRIDEQTYKEIRQRISDSEGDLRKFKASLEGWFDDTMERAKGWYKRKVQLFLFVIGFILAMCFNVNTFKIVSVLSRDKDARNQLVTLAGSVEKQNQYSSINTIAGDTSARGEHVPDSMLQKRDSILRAAYSTLENDAKAANKILATGWGFDTIPENIDSTSNPVIKQVKNVYFKGCYILKNTFSPISNFGGFLITALALSLGASFWFDMLKKLVAIRGAGASPEQTSKEVETSVSDKGIKSTAKVEN